MTTNRSGLAARALPTDALVTFKPGMRPVASPLPETFRVFISDRRQTTVLIDGRPVALATVALQKA